MQTSDALGAAASQIGPAFQRFANHLMNHFEQWFAYLFEPKIEPTNRQAETAIRPAVVIHKVWGGNRTAAGAKLQSVLMSVIETARRHARSVIDHLAGTVRAFGNPLREYSALRTVSRAFWRCRSTWNLS